jgi:hypothetical protein
VQQELSDGGILGQPNGPVEGGLGFGSSSDLLQQVSANCPVGLVIGYESGLDAIQNGQASVRSVCLASCCSVPRVRANGGR